MKDFFRLAGMCHIKDVASVSSVYNGKLDELIKVLSAVSRKRWHEICCISRFCLQWKIGNNLFNQSINSAATANFKYVTSVISV